MNQPTTIIIHADNTPGVFFRILGLLRKKMLNVESSLVQHTHKEGVSKITITVSGDTTTVSTIGKKLINFVNVISVEYK